MNNDKFLEKVLVFVDRNGIVLSKSSNPMSANLKMEYKKDELYIEMKAYAHCMGNGSCSATIKYKNKVVYNAGGSFTSSPFNTKVEVYKPGKWEKLIQ